MEFSYGSKVKKELAEIKDLIELTLDELRTTEIDSNVFIINESVLCRNVLILDNLVNKMKKNLSEYQYIVCMNTV